MARGARQGGTYRIGEVALASRVSRQTLHQYVLLGLLEPVGRTPGGHRCFSAGVFRRLDEIRALQKDRTLAEIREHFAARRPRVAAKGRAR